MGLRLKGILVSFVYIAINSTNFVTYSTKRVETTWTISENYSTIASVPYLIQLKDTDGNIVLSKIQNINWNEPPIKWKPREEVLAFIHIAKSGGMSFERALRESVLMGNNCSIKCSNSVEQLGNSQPNCPQIQPILCHDHFD